MQTSKNLFCLPMYSICIPHLIYRPPPLSCARSKNLSPSLVSFPPFSTQCDFCWWDLLPNLSRCTLRLKVLLPDSLCGRCLAYLSPYFLYAAFVHHPIHLQFMLSHTWQQHIYIHYNIACSMRRCRLQIMNMDINDRNTRAVIVYGSVSTAIQSFNE